MAIDKDAIREHVRGILAALGDDPDREGLKETPDRVACMYEEVFEGMNYTNHEIAMMFNKSFKDDLCVGSDKRYRLSSGYPDFQLLRTPHRPHVRYVCFRSIHSKRKGSRIKQNCKNL